MEERERCYSFILSRTPHETKLLLIQPVVSGVCHVTTHALTPKGQQRHHKHSPETPTLYQNDLIIRNTAGGTGGKPIAVRSQSISDVSAVNPIRF
jgi:hypothetical protein